MVDDPPQKSAAYDTSQEVGEDTVAGTITLVRFRPCHRPGTLLFLLACDTKPLVKRVKTRIFTKRCSCVRFVVHVSP